MQACLPYGNHRLAGHGDVLTNQTKRVFLPSDRSTYSGRPLLHHFLQGGGSACVP
jgi:hypothetical protein